MRQVRFRMHQNVQETIVSDQNPAKLVNKCKGDACFNAEGMEKCEQSAHLCLRLLQTRKETETDQRLHAPPCAYNCDLLPPINFIRNVGVVYLKIRNILTYYTLEINLSPFR